MLSPIMSSGLAVLAINFGVILAGLVVLVLFVVLGILAPCAASGHGKASRLRVPAYG